MRITTALLSTKNGNFEGWIWGENIGWIHLRSVYFVDFKLFAEADFNTRL